MSDRETSLPQSREEHRQLLANASADFRAGVAYACELTTQELFHALLCGETHQSIIRRLNEEAVRIRSEATS